MFYNLGLIVFLILCYGTQKRRRGGRDFKYFGEREKVVQQDY
jgi:hypothetical protein